MLFFHAILCKVVPTFGCVGEILGCVHSNAILSCGTRLLYKVVLTFEAVTIQMKPNK